MRAIVVLTLLSACDSTPQLHIKVRAPAGVKLDPTRLHIDAAAQHEAQFTPTYGPANIHGQVVTDDGIDATIGNGIGSFYAYVRAWYDTNGTTSAMPATSWATPYLHRSTSGPAGACRTPRTARPISYSRRSSG